ncbi:unnamed protein product [Periconia digitata]|uniref:Uncharacterized protein n=1 Tax=Periconia digitata TaxID=1303443 RepID=A0A9W4XQ92_9PLEO|nr:unnamed protein product [Periconia digitata]
MSIGMRIFTSPPTLICIQFGLHRSHPRLHSPRPRVLVRSRAEGEPVCISACPDCVSPANLGHRWS